eukprot:7232422-Ditylum_brightwellii.AAC.1
MQHFISCSDLTNDRSSSCIWEKMFDELKTFKEQNGHCNVSTNDAQKKSLGKWVSYQRTSKNALRSDRLQRLNSIGFVWDPQHQSWNEKFNQLCLYKAQNGHSNVSRNDEQNKCLGRWVSKQRGLQKRNALSPD